MIRSWRGRLALLFVLGLAGCGTAVSETDPTPVDEPEPRLGDKADADVSAWLSLPRKDLAKLGDEWAETVAKQRALIQANPQMVDLLPKFLPPLSPPGLIEAAYSAKNDMSLPRYLAEGKVDPGLAIHLARFGDHEGACKLIAAGDRGTKKKLDACKYEKNYPIEWTRLIGLVQIANQIKLTLGDPDGATQLVLTHKQLQSVLDTQAAASPLGVALLSAGKRVLTAAAEGYREPKRNKILLADDIAQALTQWASTPATAPALPLGSPRSEVLTILGGVARGKAVLCSTAASVQRALDVLELPIPSEGVASAIGFLDAKDRLAMIQLTYRAKVDTLYPTLGHVGYVLSERGCTTKSGGVSGLVAESFYRAGQQFEAIRCDSSSALGAVVRVTSEKSPLTPASTGSLNDFGEVRLDRAFETTRVRIAKAKAGPVVSVKEADTLKRLSTALELPVAAEAILAREKDTPLIASYELHWSYDDNDVVLESILPVFWSSYGPGVLSEVDDAHSQNLVFTWQSDTRVVQFRLPHDQRGPFLHAFSIEPNDKRIPAVAANEIADRKARLASGKADERLPRSPGIANEMSLRNLKLGSVKSVALAALPRGKSYVRSQGENWARVAIVDEPSLPTAYWLRELLVRFADGKVEQIRLRYQPPMVRRKKSLSLWQQLSDSTVGAAEALKPHWRGLWGDLSGSHQSASYRWQDDRTIRLYHEDNAAIEVILQDRPGDDTQRHDNIRWTWLPTGVAGMRLGESPEAIENKGANPSVGDSEGAVVYRGPTDSPYELVMVWYGTGKQADTAVRIVAVHRDRPGIKDKEVAKALSRAWGNNVAPLGFVTRQNGASGSNLGSYFWHDDGVRVRTWVENTDRGGRLFTEWRYWPIDAKQ